MKHQFSLILFFIVLTSFKPFDIFVKGYIQFDGKREQCLIKVTKNYKNNVELRSFMKGVYTKSNGIIKKYKAEQIQGFGFVLDNKEYNFVSFKNDMNINVPFKGYVFLLCVEVGAISLFQYFYHDIAPGPLVSLSVKGSSYFISKNSSTLIKLDEKSDLINAIADDDELYKSLEQSVILLKDIPLIIKRYNNHKRNSTVPYSESSVQLEFMEE